jgi:hypothetical protein
MLPYAMLARSGWVKIAKANEAAMAIRLSSLLDFIGVGRFVVPWEFVRVDTSGLRIRLQGLKRIAVTEWLGNQPLAVTMWISPCFFRSS